MAQAPLNPAGGKAVLVQARMPDADVTRLAALAARRGVRQPVLVRALIRYALDELDRAEPEPPDEQAA
jgi:hypothetical protein